MEIGYRGSYTINVILSIQGLPSVVTFAYQSNGLYDGVPIGEACRRLQEGGATIVGLNCSRGPATMLPVLKEIRKTYKVRCVLYLVKFINFPRPYFRARAEKIKSED